MKINLILAATVLALVPYVASPHEGEKDEVGCHAEMVTGKMHCHGPKGELLPWPPVKKSRNDICHDRDSPWYERTIHFEPFKTMKACLDSGGQRPRP